MLGYAGFRAPLCLPACHGPNHRRSSLLTLSQVPLRCLRYRRWGLLAASVAAEAAYFSAAAAAWRANPRATLWVLVLPYCVSSLALMFGK